jgi:hypothetical protein
VKSHIALEAAEMNGDWTQLIEAMIVVEREGETDEALQAQILIMTPREMKAIYEQISVYYKTGTWASGSIER